MKGVFGRDWDQQCKAHLLLICLALHNEHISGDRWDRSTVDGLVIGI